MFGMMRRRWIFFGVSYWMKTVIEVPLCCAWALRS